MRIVNNHSRKEINTTDKTAIKNRSPIDRLYVDKQGNTKTIALQLPPISLISLSGFCDPIIGIDNIIILYEDVSCYN